MHMYIMHIHPAYTCTANVHIQAMCRHMHTDYSERVLSTCRGLLLGGVFTEDVCMQCVRARTHTHTPHTYSSCTLDYSERVLLPCRGLLLGGVFMDPKMAQTVTTVIMLTFLLVGGA